MHKNCVKLVQPPLIDFSEINKDDKVTILIYNTEHKFSSDANFSGTDIIKQPIFGCKVYINDKRISKQSYGLPFIRFPQGSTPKITYENNTKFTFNIHYHGLNTVGAIDGVAAETMFGISTLLGKKVTFQFPEITNNQSLLWFHSHNMFTSMELIYGGLVGLLQITDKRTKWLTDQFQYGNNQLLLTALDMDLAKDGTQTFANLITDENRSSFAVINGISAVNWYSSDKSAPFVNSLYHMTTRNLVKIDILNASLNWRVFHIGVCDEDLNIKTFYLVQTDSSLTNPTELKMTSIPVASRIGIILDLNDFKNEIAYLFFYNYDLTEIFESMPAYPDLVNDPTLTAIIPDIKQSSNPSPYPTPIPDNNQQNQQNDYTNLDYPNIDIIPQTNQILTNGNIKIPHKYRIKPFLKIILDGKDHNLCLHETITQIKKTIFGHSNYEQFKDILKQPDFEYDPKYNYTSFLNNNYFYNLPDFDSNNPIRNIFLFPETNTNAQAGGNINGTTEYVDGANRIMCDLWNSSELDLEWALNQYNLNPNNFKPVILPSSKFRIFKTNDQFSNTAMISNDTLTIQFFTDPISYGNFMQIPIATTTVIFPPNQLLNLQQWVDLINTTFRQTTVTIPTFMNPVTLDTILVCDWSFFPYALDFLYQKTVYIKSAVVKTINNSNLWIRFLGRWPLLQFFGKPMTGDTLPSGGYGLMSTLRSKQQKNNAKIKHRINKTLNKKNDNVCSIEKPKSLYTKCDEVGIYGIYDAEIQQIFPFYATNDGETQLPIPCMKKCAELIIQPNQTYIGLYDGYLNDNLNSFSVKLHSNEIWLYTNGDCADSHPIHFHLTSGYVVPQSTYNSAGLVSSKRLYNPLIYSRDIYQIGPQEQIAFYLTWPKYSSYDQTKSPLITNIGGVIHCHFLQHNDSNSMIIQYFVDKSS